MDRRELKDLAFVVAGLGSQLTGVDSDSNTVYTYQKGEECEICIQDLQRFLRRDDESRHIYDQLGKWNVVKVHLLPLLHTYREESGLVFEVVKLLVMLTLPPPPRTRNIEEQFRILQSYKEAVLGPQYLTGIMGLLAGPLARLGKLAQGSDDQLNDQDMMELLLTFLKNLLYVPDPAPTNSTSSAHMLHLQDDFILALHREQFLQLFYILATQLESSPEAKSLNLLLLEIFYLILRREEPYELVHVVSAQNLKSASTDSASTGPMNPTSKLAAILAGGKPTAAGLASRHSRFGGAFVVHSDSGRQSVQNTSYEQLIKQNVTMPAIGTRGGRKPIMEKRSTSSGQIKLILREYATQLLEGCYNELMNTVRDDLGDGKSYLMDTDTENYIWTMGFFSGFHSHLHEHKMELWKQLTDESEPPIFDISYIKSTLDNVSFTYIADRIEVWTTERAHAKIATAIQSMKHLLTAMTVMYHSASEENRRNSEVILLKLVYQPELFLDKILNQIKVFHPTRMPMSFVNEAMANIAEVVHLTLELLESTPGKITVMKRRGGRQTTTKNDGEEDNNPDQDQYEDEDVLRQQDQEKFDDEAQAHRREADEAAASREKYFDFGGYLTGYAKCSVIKNYLFLLRNYRENTQRLNCIIIKMFDRIANELKYEAIFFQVNFMRIFNVIINDKVIAKDPAFDHMRKFINGLVRKIVHLWLRDPADIAPRMLFTKNRYEALEIGHGRRFQDYNNIDLENEDRNSIDSFDEEEEPDGDWDLANEIAEQKQRIAEEQAELDEEAKAASGKAASAKKKPSAEEEYTEGTSKKASPRKSHKGAKRDIDDEEEASTEPVVPARTWTDAEDSQLKQLFEEYKDMASEDFNVFESIASMLDELRVSGWQCYKRIQQLEIEIPPSVAPPPAPAPPPSKKKSTSSPRKTNAKGKRKAAADKIYDSNSDSSEELEAARVARVAGVTSALQRDKENEKTAKAASRKQSASASRPKRATKKTEKVSLADLYKDDDSDEEAQEKKRKKKKKGSGDEDDFQGEEEPAANEEEQPETPKKKRKAETAGAAETLQKKKRDEFDPIAEMQRRREDRLAVIRARYTSDVVQAPDGSDTSPKKKRLRRTASQEGEEIAEERMDLTAGLDDQDVNIENGSEGSKKRKRGLLDEDELGLDFGDDDSNTGATPNTTNSLATAASNATPRKGRKLIDEDDE